MADQRFQILPRRSYAILYYDYVWAEEVIRAIFSFKSTSLGLSLFVTYLFSEVDSINFVVTINACDFRVINYSDSLLPHHGINAFVDFTSHIFADL